MLYHLISRSDFDSQPADEPYFAASLVNEGFIHLSATPAQVAWVAANLYPDVPDLAVLVIDESLLSAPLRFDETPTSTAHSTATRSSQSNRCGRSSGRCNTQVIVRFVTGPNNRDAIACNTR